VWRYLQRAGTGRHGFDVETFAERVERQTEMHAMAVESALRQLEGAGHLRSHPEGLEVLEDVAPGELRVDYERLDRRRRVAHEQVDNVVQYASSDGCRQASLLEHFGTEPSFGRRCGHCSHCAPPPHYAGAGADALSETVVCSDEPTTVLRKVLSGVARARGRRGATAVAGMLVGSSAKAVKEAGFTDLSTYGILGGVRKKDATRLIDLLGRHGLIRRNEYGCVLLTERGGEVMRGDS
ncbi:MAG: RQC domain-containing protein, partial [Bradymonadaceae bacterium]